MAASPGPLQTCSDELASTQAVCYEWFMVESFSSKAFRGETPTVADWERALQDAHARYPAMTPAVFGVHRTLDGRTSYEVLAETLMASAPPRPSVLDLACGNGHLLRYLGGRADAVTGVDMSPAELALARREWAERPQTSFIEARAHDLPLADASVRFVLCHMALMLMVPLPPVLAEVGRVLSSGGIFAAVINAPTPDESSTYARARLVVRQFLRREFPLLPAKLPVGDERLNAALGIAELFADRTTWCEPEIYNFVLTADVDRAGFWERFSDTYFVGMLAPAVRTKLQVEMEEFFAANERGGRLQFEIPLRRIKVGRS